MKVFFGGKRDEVGKYIRKNKAEFYQWVICYEFFDASREASSSGVWYCAGIVFGFESIILSASTWADPTLGVKTTGLVQIIVTLMPGNANFVSNL
jgi:hypothetical protein